MELDEKIAKHCRADGRLEKPFEVDNLRQLVLKLVPRTHSQRLAHFLQFSPAVAEPMRKEESAKKDDAAKAQRPTATVPPPPVAPPKTPTPPPAAAKKDSSSWSMDSFEDINDFADDENADLAPPPMQQTSSKIKGKPPVEEADADEETEFKFADLGSQGAATAPASPPPAAPPVQAKAKAPAGAKSEVPSDSSPATSDERDPWSHQDLSRFKLDLDPVSVDSDDLNFEVGDPNVQDHVHGTEFLLKTNRTNPDDEIREIDPGQMSDANLELEPHDEPSRREPSDDEHPLPGSLGPLDLALEAPNGTPLKLSEDRLETILRAQSREVIEEVVRRIVPDLASEIIRQELQRLLQEPGKENGR
jgi:hypothetical protein